MAPRRTRSTRTGKSRSASVDPYTHPITVLASTNNSKAENDTSSAGDPAPTSTAVPPRRTAANTVRMVSARPTTSKTKSAPRPAVWARTAATTSSADASTTAVAPMALASSSLEANWSTATMVRAPAKRAPWITDSPTPPQPTTATVDPGVTRAVFHTAPTPVDSAQPTRAARSSGTDGSMRITSPSGTRVSSPKVAVPSPRTRGVPPTVAYAPDRDCARPTSHSITWPRRHQKQCRHAGIHVSTTWSPGATRVTASPTSATTPAPSWPSTVGNMKGIVPFCTDRSE